ncbi:MAG: ComF family protein [Pseudomonadota bacterium]
MTQGNAIFTRQRLRLAHLANSALDFVLPPRCQACGALTDRQLGLCSQCWQQLSFITQPFCTRCGVPFEFDIPGTSICASCLRRPPAFDVAFSPLVYDDMARTLILQLKYGDRLAHARLLGTLMASQVAQLGLVDPLVLPIPLHHWRLMGRRFNQAALLAKEVARTQGLTLDVLTLLRHKATPRQQGLNRSERQRNVRSAFALRRGRQERIKGRDILLVDDVFTTGATVEACCKPLRKGGAKRIAVLTAARVAGPQTASL